MKTQPVSYVALLALLLSVTPASAEKTVKPVVVGTKGSVTVAAVPVQPKQSVELGSEIATGRGSAATLALAPGLAVTLGPKTTLKLVASSMGKARYAEAGLVQGTVVSTVTPPAGVSQKYRLGMGHGEYAEAIGTSWKSTVDGNKKQVAVTSGQVSWTSMLGGEPIILSEGSVLIAEYEGTGPEMRLVSLSVVNLVDGTVTTYPLDGGPPVTTEATAGQLAMARDLFGDALGGLDGQATEDRSALLSLLFSVNKTLAAAGLGSVSTSSAADDDDNNDGGSTPRTVSSNNPADIVSPITP